MANESIFNSGAFDFQSLTQSINAAPYKPGRISKLGLFEEKGIASTKAMIEMRNSILSLVPTSLRGAPGTTHEYGRRTSIELDTVHLLSRSTILADSIQDKREFGGNQPATIQKERDERLAGMRGDIEATLEYHRIGAIKGQVLDTDGSVLLDVFSEFDVAQQTHDMALSNATINVRNKIVAAKRLSEDALGDVEPDGYLALCSAGFFDALLAHPSVEGFVAGWSAAEMLREDRRLGVSLGSVMFEEYRGKMGGSNWIADGDAYLIPVGVPGLLISRFAPADYADSVNLEGLPLYARAHELPFNRGVMLEAQSNPINLCTRPRAIIKLTA